MKIILNQIRLPVAVIFFSPREQFHSKSSTFFVTNHDMIRAVVTFMASSGANLTNSLDHNQFGEPIYASIVLSNES